MKKFFLSMNLILIVWLSTISLGYSEFEGDLNLDGNIDGSDLAIFSSDYGMNLQKKSLCEFPFGSYGNFEVRYDYRIYDPNYYSNQYPNGGITLDLYLGRFQTVIERDNVTDSINKVVFINHATGDTYEVTKADKFAYTVDYSGCYMIRLGEPSKVIGAWDIIVQSDDTHYKASFLLTETMLEQSPPLPVEATVVENIDGSFTITTLGTNADYYVLRIFNDNDIVFNQSMNFDTSIGKYAINVPALYSGLMARIEARGNQLSNWVLLMEYGQPETCDDDGMLVGYGAVRASTWIKLSEVNPVYSIDINELIGVWDQSHVDSEISEIYLHFFNDDTFLLEASSYPTPDSHANSPIFIYGTFSLINDTIALQPDHAEDINGNSIVSSSIDYCWINSPLHDSITFTSVYIKSNPTTSQAELTLREGATVTYEPDISHLPSCDGNQTISVEMTFGFKSSDNPGQMVLK